MKQMRVLVAVLLALALAPLAVGQTPAGGASAAPDHLVLTWTGDPAATQTITWRTDTTVKSGGVQFQAGEALTEAKEAKATPREFATDLGPTRLFTATLTGLTPQTTYTYRVGDGGRWSPMHTFSTAARDAAAFAFLVFGDSQSGARQPIYAPWEKTARNAYRAHPESKFLINVGDLVEVGQSAAHWDAWFAAAQGVVDTIPEMAVEGNHETYSLKPDPTNPGKLKLTPGKPSFWIAQFALPQNGPEELKGQVYSFDYGPAHFVVLDSQQEEEQGDMLTAQQAWLKADLAASRATWKLVFFHKPPYGVSPLRPNAEVRQAFCPIFDAYHVDLVFNGHDHAIARTYPMKKGRLVQKPSQGTVYYVVGRSGNKVYSAAAKRPFHAFVYNPVDQPNYLFVEVTRTRLVVTTVKQDGTILDAFSSDKADDVDSDSVRALPAAAASR